MSKSTSKKKSSGKKGGGKPLKKYYPSEEDVSPKQRDELFLVLKKRFESNMHRHEGLEWSKIQAKLEENPDKLWSLNEMEITGEN